MENFGMSASDVKFLLNKPIDTTGPQYADSESEEATEDTEVKAQEIKISFDRQVNEAKSSVTNVIKNASLPYALSTKTASSGDLNDLLTSVSVPEEVKQDKGFWDWTKSKVEAAKAKPEANVEATKAKSEAKSSEQISSGLELKQEDVEKEMKALQEGLGISVDDVPNYDQMLANSDNLGIETDIETLKKQSPELQKTLQENKSSTLDATAKQNGVDAPTIESIKALRAEAAANGGRLSTEKLEKLQKQMDVVMKDMNQNASMKLPPIQEAELLKGVVFAKDSINAGNTNRFDEATSPLSYETDKILMGYAIQNGAEVVDDSPSPKKPSH